MMKGDNIPFRTEESRRQQTKKETKREREGGGYAKTDRGER